MRFKYIGGIGVPGNCKVVYDQSRKELKTKYKRKFETGELFSVCTADTNLNLHFRIADGVFVGLSCARLDLSELPKHNTVIQYAPDGEIKADCRLKDVIPDCTYFGFDGGASYDESTKTLLFGAISDNHAVYRVLDNAYVSTSFDGSLSGVLIRL